MKLDYKKIALDRIKYLRNEINEREIPVKDLVALTGLGYCSLKRIMRGSRQPLYWEAMLIESAVETLCQTLDAMKLDDYKELTKEVKNNG